MHFLPSTLPQMSHAIAIVEQLLKGLEGRDSQAVVRMWLKQEGNPELTLKAVIGLLAEHGASRAVDHAAHMLQSAIDGTVLDRHDVRQLIEAETFHVVPSPADEWEVV